jgi:hypothetical protein
MMTIFSSMMLRVDRGDVHAAFDIGRAGADALAIGAIHPAILTGAHIAETGTRTVAELRLAQLPPGQQHRGEHRVAGQTRNPPAIDPDFQSGPCMLSEPHELAASNLFFHDLI